VTTLAVWVLTLMVALQPAAPWRASYDDTARAIAQVVTDEAPVYPGEFGRERTAALLVSVAWFESNFQPGAVGDCGHKGPCAKGEKGRSHGLYQVQGHGDLEDPVDATRAALGMVRASFKVCRARDVTEYLGWYAAGGNDCARGLPESRHRVRKAQWLFRAHPPPAPAP
jgi:hypothetical protein